MTRQRQTATFFRFLKGRIGCHPGFRQSPALQG